MGTEPLEEGGGLKFSLMDIRDDKSYLFDDSLYAHPLGEFTAPKNLDTYPGGLLEYIVQCARKKGAKRIGFKLMECKPDGNWETQEDLCAKIIDELVNKHYQASPHPDETEPFINLGALPLTRTLQPLLYLLVHGVGFYTTLSHTRRRWGLILKLGGIR